MSFVTAKWTRSTPAPPSTGPTEEQIIAQFIREGKTPAEQIARGLFTIEIRITERKDCAAHWAVLGMKGQLAYMKLGGLMETMGFDYGPRVDAETRSHLAESFVTCVGCFDEALRECPLHGDQTARDGGEWAAREIRLTIPVNNPDGSFEWVD